MSSEREAVDPDIVDRQVQRVQGDSRRDPVRDELVLQARGTVDDVGPALVQVDRYGARRRTDEQLSSDDAVEVAALADREAGPAAGRATGEENPAVIRGRAEAGELHELRRVGGPEGRPVEEVGGPVVDQADADIGQRGSDGEVVERVVDHVTDAGHRVAESGAGELVVLDDREPNGLVDVFRAIEVDRVQAIGDRVQLTRPVDDVDAS